VAVNADGRPGRTVTCTSRTRKAGDVLNTLIGPTIRYTSKMPVSRKGTRVVAILLAHRLSVRSSCCSAF